MEKNERVLEGEVLVFQTLIKVVGRQKVLDFEKPEDLFYQKVIWKIALDGGMGVHKLAFQQIC